MEKKKAVCTSHHLSPIVEIAFGVRATDLSKDNTLKSLVKNKRLHALDGGGKR